MALAEFRGQPPSLARQFAAVPARRDAALVVERQRMSLEDDLHLARGSLARASVAW